MADRVVASVIRASADGETALTLAGGIGAGDGESVTTRSAAGRSHIGGSAAVCIARPPGCRRKCDAARATPAAVTSQDAPVPAEQRRGPAALWGVGTNGKAAQHAADRRNEILRTIDGDFAVTQAGVVGPIPE